MSDFKTYYQGRGNHSVHNLETMVEQAKEENILVTAELEAVKEELSGVKEVCDLFNEAGKALVKCEECGIETTENMCDSDHFDNGETSGWSHICKVCSTKEEIAKLRLVERNLELAVKGLEFYSTNDIHSINFNWTDNGKLARETLQKIGRGK